MNCAAVQLPVIGAADSVRAQANQRISLSASSAKQMVDSWTADTRKLVLHMLTDISQYSD